MIDYDKDGSTFIDLMDETQINTGLISESTQDRPVIFRTSTSRQNKCINWLTIKLIGS